jgi:hypothetical protein
MEEVSGEIGEVGAVLYAVEVRPRWLETSKIRPVSGISGHGWPSSQSRRLRRHRAPNILALLASHRTWALKQGVMNSPPSSCRSPESVPDLPGLCLRWQPIGRS